MIAMTRKASPRFSYIGLTLVYFLVATVGCSAGYAFSPSTPSAKDICVSSAASSASASTPGVAISARFDLMTNQYTGNGGGEGFLRAVAAISDTNVWVVGNTASSALIEHWNGSTWSIVPSPDPGVGNQAVLYGITVVSANDIWAVGRYSIGTTPTKKTLIEHWNGSSWSIISSPNVQQYQENVLQGITAISASNIWVVGAGFVDRSQAHQANQQFGYCTLIEHWDGTSWTILPHSQIDGGLAGVAASSSRNIWAVGSQSYPQPYHTLIERWDGSNWRVIPSPNVQRDNILQGVAVNSASDAWAVGLTSPHFPQASQSLIEHWDGSHWSIIANVPVKGELDGVAVNSSTDAWAIGYLDLGNSIAQTLIEHWNGTRWSIIPSPNIGGVKNTNQLVAIAAISSKNVWAVGGFYDSSICDRNPMCSPNVLIEHWNGQNWSSIPPAH